jgi:hypothetical protein
MKRKALVISVDELGRRYYEILRSVGIGENLVLVSKYEEARADAQCLELHPFDDEDAGYVPDIEDSPIYIEWPE